MKKYIVSLYLVFFVKIVALSVPPCSAVGTLIISGSGTVANGVDIYDISDGGTVNLKPTGYTIPSGQLIGIAFFTTKPTLPLTASQLADLYTVTGYKGSDYFKSGGVPNTQSPFVSTDNNTNGTSATIPGSPNVVWAFVYFSDQANAVDGDGSGDVCIGTLIQLNYLTTTTPPSPCGTCAAPDCPIGNLPTYKDRYPSVNPGCIPSSSTNCPGSGAKKCATGLSASGTYVSYQTVTSDKFGNLGALIQEVELFRPSGPGSKNYTLTSNLYAMNDCNGFSIPTDNFNTLAPLGTTNNVFNRGATNGKFNPEWKNLSPNTNYILKTTFIIDPGAELTDYCMEYYGSTSCNANNGSSVVKINGATPPTLKNPSTNAYILCKGDVLDIKTTGATPSVDYAIFVGPPTSNDIVTQNTSSFTKEYYNVSLNEMSETSKGDASDIFTFVSGLTGVPKTISNNTIWWVPVTTATAGMLSDASCYHMDYQNEAFKVTYLNEISVDTATECTSTNKRFKLKILGGSPEFVTGSTYSISSNKGKFSSTNSATATMTSSGGIDYLTELVSGETFTITITDGVGCTKTVTGKYFCPCSAPTITPTPAEVCHGATTTSFSYSGLTNSPDKYSITWNAAGIAAGFTNITDATLSSSPISVNIPVTASPQTYIGSLTVKNSTTGCVSTAQNISFGINGNPTLTATPISILVGGTASISVSGGSGIGATSNTWKTLSNTANTISGVTGNTQPITVTGVASGNEDVIYTDNKGCDDTVTIAVSILGCNTITKITPDQVWCQGIDPNAIEVSTNETATDGIRFIVYPAAIRPTTGAAVYSGGVPIKKVTPASGKASLDLPALGTLGSLPVTLAGDYYVYAILNPTPSNTACRPYAEIKVTIKDSIIPVITAGTITSNNTTFTWSDIPSASKFGVDTARLVNPVTPFPWKSANDVLNTTAGTGNSFTFNSITLGQTAHIKITPLDNTNNKLACSNSAISSILNPSCTKLDLQPLNIPDTVCAGESLEVLKGKLNPTTLSFDFIWLDSTDQHDWAPISPNIDYVITSPTNDSTKLAIKTNFTMNNSLIKLVAKHLPSGECSDTTLPVKIMVNEIPDASISISPDPAKLCVGDPDPIEVTFQGSKGVKPYRFDFKLDASPKDTTSSSPDGKVIFPFTTVKPIDDTTFILDSITDKNGCTAKFTGKTVKLEVVPVPKPEFQADKTIGCYPLEVIFTDKSAVLNTDVEWDFGNGDVDNTSLGVVKYIFQKSGDYTISFKSTINGCSDTTQKTDYIHVKDRPEAQFSPKKTNISLIDPEIQFINSSSSNSVYYKWIFGDGSPVSNLVNPKHIYIGNGSTGLPNPGKYTVELYAYINQDCWDSTSTTITIDDEQIYYIPNTFTPNGDEKNNTFQPVFTSGYDPQNYHFFIYNRWGEVIFESNNPTIGWDGTYGSKLLANDTYTWKLQFKEKMTEKEHFLTGHVNLFK